MRRDTPVYNDPRLNRTSKAGIGVHLGYLVVLAATAVFVGLVVGEKQRAEEELEMVKARLSIRAASSLETDQKLLIENALESRNISLNERLKVETERVVALEEQLALETSSRLGLLSKVSAQIKKITDRDSQIQRLTTELAVTENLLKSTLASLETKAPTLIDKISERDSQASEYVKPKSGDEYFPIVKVQPQYPRRALSRGMSGWVIVEFTVTAQGTVTDPFVVSNCGWIKKSRIEGKCEDNPNSVFDSAATKAAVKFKYQPKVIDGDPVATVGVRNKISFGLVGD